MEAASSGLRLGEPRLGRSLHPINVLLLEHVDDDIESWYPCSKSFLGNSWQGGSSVGGVSRAKSPKFVGFNCSGLRCLVRVDNVGLGWLELKSRLTGPVPPYRPGLITGAFPGAQCVLVASGNLFPGVSSSSDISWTEHAHLFSPRMGMYGALQASVSWDAMHFGPFSLNLLGVCAPMLSLEDAVLCWTTNER